MDALADVPEQSELIESEKSIKKFKLSTELKSPNSSMMLRNGHAQLSINRINEEVESDDEQDAFLNHRSLTNPGAEIPSLLNLKQLGASNII